LNKNKLFIALFTVMFLVLIAIVAFQYAKYMIFPGLTVFYAHIIGIAFGVMIIGATAYRVQNKQEKLLIEKIEETERRIQSEASFRKVEENYRRLFIDSMDGVCKTTLDGKIIEANHAFCDILGCDADKIIGESIIQFYDNPEDRIQFRDVIEKNKGIKNYEIIQKRIDETRIICAISSSFFYSQKGEPEGYLTILRDITDRKRAEQEMAIFAEIGRVIGSTMNINEVFERFAAEAKKLIPFDRIAVNLYNIHTNIATIAYVSGADLSNHKQGDSFPLTGTVTKEFLRKRTGQIIQSEKMDEIVRRIPSLSRTVQAGLRSIIGVPLIYKDEAVGVLQFRSKTPNAYSDQDLHLAERIGAQIAGAIANTQLFADLTQVEQEQRLNRERAERLAEETAIVAEIGRVIGSTMNIDEVYERFATEAKKLIHFDRIAVNLCNTPDNTLTVGYVSGTDISNREKGGTSSLEGTLTNEVLRRRTSLIIQPESPEGIDEIVRRIPKLLPTFEAGLRSLLCVPLISRNEVIGTLHFRSKKTNAYTDQDLRLAERIGAQIAGAIANVKLFAEIQNTEKELKESEKRYRELSIIDDLTQLYNSRHFHFHLKNELERSNRYGQPLTLLLLDLDNFKHFNDTYGHVEGDQVLWRLGQVVKRCLRETDFAYRYGGEEFTVLLPMTTSMEGFVTAERIRTEFKKETFSPAPGQDVHVTVSIGLAQYKPPEEMKAFVHRVDQLMYQGKKDGKDRVCYEPSPQEQYKEQSSLPF
jgi:diguanylate cyclase (GGDEF)-like protein/PAS domain S-box-containing protein